MGKGRKRTVQKMKMRKRQKAKKGRARKVADAKRQSKRR